MGLLFDRDYTKEFHGVSHEIKLTKNEIKLTNEEIAVLNEKMDSLQKDLELIKSYLFKPQEVSSPKELKRSVGTARQKAYSNIRYKDFEFITGKKPVPSFDISDVYKLSLFIDNFDKFPSVRKLYTAVLPNKSISTFERLLYNYQQNLFEKYLIDYIDNTTFTSKGGLLYINGINTNLTINQISEMSAIVDNNANDIYSRYDCIDKFVKQYSTHESKYIKIVGDFMGSYKLQRLVSLHKKPVSIENNPQKRKEKII